MAQKKGLLVVFEGIDGSGKTTQARSLLRRLRRRGIGARYFREPSRGRWGREIKRKAARAGSLTPAEELDLFLKDRRENVARNLLPALARKAVVVLDRYYFSTMAYQGAKGLDPAAIRRTNERFAVKPDIVFVLDIPAPGGLARIAGRKRKDLLFEREDYLRKVRRIFRGLRGREFAHLDAGGDRREIGRRVWTRVEKLIRRHWGERRP